MRCIGKRSRFGRRRALVYNIQKPIVCFHTRYKNVLHVIGSEARHLTRELAILDAFAIHGVAGVIIRGHHGQEKVSCYVVAICM